MQNIPNKTDGVDTLPATDFNSHKNEVQTLVTESGQTLAIGTTDQLRKAVSIFSRSIYTSDSSGAANTLTLARPTALTDINAYYDGMTLIFDTPNANTGATTVTVNGLGSKKVRTADDNDISAGDILAGVQYTLVYKAALDSAAGAFQLMDEVGARINNPKSIIHNITVDADYTLTASQNTYGRIEITDTGVLLTVGRNIIVDNTQKRFIFVNSTAQTLTVKTAAGTGIEVSPTIGKNTVDLYNDGTNVIRSVDLSLTPIIAAGSATFTNATNNIALTGIGIGVDIGDVLLVEGSVSNDKAFTIEVITDDNNVIVNQAHAGGTTTKSLVNETVAVKVSLLAKYYNAPIGLGQGAVILNAVRTGGVSYPNNTNRAIRWDYANNTNNPISITLDSTVFSYTRSGTFSTSRIIPPGSSYQAEFNADASGWVEIR